MKRLTAEWVAKAEADHQGAVALQRRRKQPLPDLYPGLTATAAQARTAVQSLRLIRRRLRKRLGI